MGKWWSDNKHKLPLNTPGGILYVVIVIALSVVDGLNKSFGLDIQIPDGVFQALAMLGLFIKPKSPPALPSPPKP